VQGHAAPAAVVVQAETGAGAINVEGTTAEVEVQTRAWSITLSNLGGRIRARTQAGGISGRALTSPDVEAASNAGAVSLSFDAPPDRVDAQTNAGVVELAVPDDRYAVDARAEHGEVKVGIASDPDAPRRLTAHSNAGALRVRRR
jgi:DUF4097 and DUF4098 domain-containing protein YvlB